MKQLAVVLFTLTVTLFALAAPAEAGEGGRRERKLDKIFARLDADRDGRISRAEAEAAGPRLAKHFGEVDGNKDGFVTRAELKAALRRMHEQKQARRQARKLHREEQRQQRPPQGR